MKTKKKDKMASTLLVGLLLILHAVVVHGERTECDATFRGKMFKKVFLSSPSTSN